jgi:glycosyltransferase involved in cell wall biosynthesis
MKLYEAGFSNALEHWTKTAYDQAGRIIALSENTRRDLEEQGVEPERIRVIYGGGNIVSDDEMQQGRAESVRKRLGLSEKYILFVGTIHPRKNIPLLLRSFAKLKRDHRLPHQLVLAGRPDAAYVEVQQLIASLGIGDDVVITGYVEDFEIPLLYKMADLFVLPSRYEGFGMCIVEAMSYGVPAVVTDTSCIREVVGDAAMMVPLDNVEALASAMYRGLTDRDLRNRLVKQGKRQAAQFTWDRCAAETLAVYQELQAQRLSDRATVDCAGVN